MMRSFQIFILFFVLLTLTNCKKAENDILYNKKYIDEIKQARKEIGFYLQSNLIPGAQIAISKNGELIYSEGIGLASKDLEVKTTRDTKFRIGSLSEMFTTLAYLKMVEDGTLIPDSTVQHYLPEFPKKQLPLTVKNLENHTSGIREMNNQERNWTALNVGIEKGLEVFQNDELMAPPGVFQKESRLNFNLLGAIMEKATGKHFHEVLKEYVTDTLHFENTVPDNLFGTVKGRTDFYDHNIIAQVVNSTSLDLRWRLPSDGLLSSAEDLVKMGNVFLNSDYLNADTREMLFQPDTLGNNTVSQFVNGWIILHDRKGNLAYGREGYVHGGSSAVLIFPEEQLVLAMTANLTQDRANFPLFLVADFFLPKQGEARE
ncbi:serine hydrolase domain-containing protein [Draconibacterium sp. IB214405]|uniref:serine hydrolase domain-containing protein n=1 Tax=Draconibacterium sp. IB214405 TaxID=3097352 RepID=UPI002A11B160|nr:serine hydrolase domain-containing protein [Draconibacterium sp. IB214405]MDX8340405.1 serine hydrolase domain-containing protein [Draconibacterium sp. IB214405]